MPHIDLFPRVRLVSAPGWELRQSFDGRGGRVAVRVLNTDDDDLPRIHAVPDPKEVA